MCYPSRNCISSYNKNRLFKYEEAASSSLNLLRHLPDNLLHTSPVSTSFCLFRRHGHDAPEILPVCLDQPGNHSPHLIVAQLRPLQVRLQDVHLLPLLLSQFGSSTLFIKRNSLLPLFDFLLYYPQTISLRQRSSVLSILAIRTRHLKIMNSTQRHTQSIQP